MPQPRRRFDPSLFRYSRGVGGQVVNPRLRGVGRYSEERQTEGYVYEGTTPFRFKTAGGETRTIQPGERLSSRQYQNLRYRASGFESKSQYERISSQSVTRSGRKRLTYKRGKRDVHEIGAFRVWGKLYAQRHNVSLGSALDPESDYARAFAAALADDFSDLTPDGPFAHLLTLVGLRDDQADWNVGETQAT